ncbi:low temperature requirement protein A [Streptococcus chenjunshii]|uniref:Low temperature requirement protein A n=1 Tax=Streptococcus chenjunshii TaxID=2173853 RepID=A0A372KN72_9STRE|nr:low temperature requirement protein A [Streptococcus chenjunshii]AXQ78846.1 low temperature requirement protein A [Streptococcus chenjunshii]RFU51607.1 low temperature requirement protein A [Streptococcus chenjunshii]RFU53727.1 low temperature requirement protein A [Streptococcus chenjunshii]
MSVVQHKKVELTELFYDLVYVYAISQVTSLIHHVHHGIVEPYAFFTFFIGLIIFINSWMVQTVFTNRFGSNSLTNILFMFAQMICLLISSTAVTEDWSSDFTLFILPVAFISFILLLQYVAEYFKTDNQADKQFIRQFFYILGIRSAVLFLAVWLPYQIGLLVAAAGIIFTWLLPSILTAPTKRMMHEGVTPLSFPHLIERLSLLVIITFGEMLIGIAPYFTRGRLSLDSFLIFLIVTNLFMIYIVEIDHLIDVNTSGVSGNGAIYYHYPILFGLSLVTVSLGFLGNQEADSGFALLMLYLGILLLLGALFLHGAYNKKTHRFNRSFYLSNFGLLVCGFVVSLFFLNSAHVLVMIAFLTTMLIMILFVRFNLKRLSPVN